MRFKNPDKLARLKFLGKYRDAIIKEYLAHRPKTGYVFLKADSLFHATEPPRFIQRDFDKEQFLSLLEEEETTDEKADQEEEWIYYEVYWDSDKTSYHIKERI